jgi:hypothetical protein
MKLPLSLPRTGAIKPQFERHRDQPLFCAFPIHPEEHERHVRGESCSSLWCPFILTRRSREKEL